MEQTNSPLVSPEENLPPAPDQPKPSGVDFVRKYSTPLAILAGAVIIAVSIYFTFHSPVPSSSKNPASNPPAKTRLVPPTVDGAPVLGAAGAQVTIVEFADFQCPFCGRFFRETLPKIKDNYIATGKVKFFLNDFAFLGPESGRAAEAAKCAADQGKFWEYHDYLYSHQSGENEGAFGDDHLKQFAQVVGLKQQDFGTCLDSQKYQQAVRDETRRGQASGVSGTPTFFINGQKLVGAQPYEVFAQAIDSALKK